MVIFVMSIHSLMVNENLPETRANMRCAHEMCACHLQKAVFRPYTMGVSNNIVQLQATRARMLALVLVMTKLQTSR